MFYEYTVPEEEAEAFEMVLVDRRISAEVEEAVSIAEATGPVCFPEVRRVRMGLRRAAEAVISEVRDPQDRDFEVIPVGITNGTRMAITTSKEPEEYRR